MIIKKTKKYFSQKVTKRKQCGGSNGKYSNLGGTGKPSKFLRKVKSVFTKSGKSNLNNAIKTSKRRQKYAGMTTEQLEKAKRMALLTNVVSPIVRGPASILGAEVALGARIINAEALPATLLPAAVSRNGTAMTKHTLSGIGTVYKKLAGKDPSTKRKILASVGTGVASLGIVPGVAATQLARSTWRGIKAPWKTWGRTRRNIAAVQKIQATTNATLQASHANAKNKQKDPKTHNPFNQSKLVEGIAAANARIKRIKNLQMQGLTPAEIENTMSSPNA
jgi:hypothetical protein